jgi:hypothetical protein
LRKRKEKGEKTMKKLISILIGMLLLTSAALVFTPQTKAMFLPEIFVSPAQNKFRPPCIVSTEFDISVKIFNQYEETGAEIYAFDFWLFWLNSTYGMDQGSLKQAMITLVNIEVKPPWNEGEYFIIANETNFNKTTGLWDGIFMPSVTWHDPFKDVDHTFYNLYWNYYHLAITALNKAPPLIDVKVPVVDLTFHIDDEPLYRFTLESPWGVGWYTPFKIMNSTMSCINPLTNEPEEVEHLREDGAYWIYAKQPEMWLSTEKPWDVDEDGDTDFYYIVRWTNCTWFTVEVNVKNVGKMYSFELWIGYNASLLNTDIQHIHVKDFLPPPYEILDLVLVPPTSGNIWEEWSYIHITAKRPCNKPPVCGSGAIVNIDFHTKCPTDHTTDLKPVYLLPQSVKSYIWIYYAKIDSKYIVDSLPCTKDYIWPGGLLDIGPPQDPIMDLLYNTHTDYWYVEYYFEPLPMDLDQSGHVDIIDLQAIAKQYGKDLTCNPYATAFTQLASPYNQPVDLYDVVYVAKYFCKDFAEDLGWPIDPYTGELYDP